MAVHGDAESTLLWVQMLVFHIPSLHLPHHASPRWYSYSLTQAMSVYQPDVAKRCCLLLPPPQTSQPGRWEGPEPLQGFRLDVRDQCRHLAEVLHLAMDDGEIHGPRLVSP